MLVHIEQELAFTMLCDSLGILSCSSEKAKAVHRPARSEDLEDSLQEDICAIIHEKYYNATGVAGAGYSSSNCCIGG